jgi:hypothetical protein
MAHYLVEHYVPAHDAGSLAGDSARLRSCGGSAIRLLMTFYAVEDETCFHLFDARSPSAVRRAIAGAGVEIDRIVGVVTVPDTGERSSDV